MKNKDKNTITQFKTYFDFDKELEYINEMNRQGWKLVYIKGGCFYTFVKTQPDEYFTTTYMDDKNKISQVITFAAQCGYESVPHTMDGIGNLLYLTAPKGKVSEEFSCDRESKIKFHSKISKFYLLNGIALLIMTLILIAETFLFSCLLASEFDMSLFTILMIGSIVGLITFIMGFFALILYIKSRKKIKQLKAESWIYE
ncbi:MAG: DUF2812 domain-containing protein [Ruminococcus sp.]|nr:DUF2812 domain-containing protein [Ruminococcus sp.]